MVVFLKTSEEAVCDPSSKCAFTWTGDIPTLEAAVLSFDETTNQWDIIVNGTDFTGDTATVELFLEGVKQTTKSVSATEAVFTIVNITSQTINTQVLYFDVGIPADHSNIESALELTPRLVSVTPSSGSVGGTLITVTVPGLAIGNTETISIVDSEGNSVCTSISAISYGLVECQTISGEMASTALSFKQGDQTYECATCLYEQSASSAFPIVASVTKGESTIVFTGTGFDLADFSASA